MYATYTNRRDEVHYLKATLTTKGNTRYYIVKNRKNVDEKDLVTDIPDGFEFYEFPEDARVVLRKKQKSIFNNEEKKIVEEIVAKQAHIDEFIVDFEENALVIYNAHLNKSDFKDDLETYKTILKFDEILRITKDNENYQMQRFCNLSNYYGWITMETNTDLKALCEKFCPHIGKESLFEFWIEGEEDW